MEWFVQLLPWFAFGSVVSGAIAVAATLYLNYVRKKRALVDLAQLQAKMLTLISMIEKRSDEVFRSLTILDHTLKYFLSTQPSDIPPSVGENLATLRQAMDEILQQFARFEQIVADAEEEGLGAEYEPLKLHTERQKKLVADQRERLERMREELEALTVAPSS